MKLGGPRMAVDSVRQTMDFDELAHGRLPPSAFIVGCRWFVSDRLQKEDFPEELLEHAATDKTEK
jgi:uncharacterized protein YodC (DUF2158 family)